MPPRYSYWTILAGGLPTAFRATEREELLPTFRRLRDKHPDAEMKWFARGRVWASPEEAQAELEQARERRNRDWRPGGEHRDPRQKYKDAKQARNLSHRKSKFERKSGGAGDDRRAASERPPAPSPRDPRPSTATGPRPRLDDTRERPAASTERRPKLEPRDNFKRDEQPRSSHTGSRPPFNKSRPPFDKKPSWSPRPSGPRASSGGGPRPRLDDTRDRPAASTERRPKLEPRDNFKRDEQPRSSHSGSRPPFNKSRPPFDKKSSWSPRPSGPRASSGGGPRPRLDDTRDRPASTERRPKLEPRDNFKGGEQPRSSHSGSRPPFNKSRPPFDKKSSWSPRPSGPRESSGGGPRPRLDDTRDRPASTERRPKLEPRDNFKRDEQPRSSHSGSRPPFNKSRPPFDKKSSWSPRPSGPRASSGGGPRPRLDDTRDRPSASSERRPKLEPRGTGPRDEQRPAHPRPRPRLDDDTRGPKGKRRP